MNERTKVWVALRDFGDEYHPDVEIVGVYSSSEKAKDSNSDVLRCWVEEHELDSVTISGRVAESNA